MKNPIHEAPPARVHHGNDLALLKSLCFASSVEAIDMPGCPRSIDWQWLILYAVRQGLAPLLWRRIQAVHPGHPALTVRNEKTPKQHMPWGIDRNLIDLLKDSYLSTLRRNMRIQHMLKALDAALTGADFPCILWKGASLIWSVYTDLGLRPMDDIDLLVPKAHLVELTHRLRALGYHPRPQYPLTWQHAQTVIDIHHDAVHADRIAARLKAMPITAEALLPESRSLPALKNMRVLSPRDSMICLAVHAMKHDFSRAVWFVDADHLVKKYPELTGRIDALARRADGFNARLPLYLFFSLLENWRRRPDASVFVELRPKRFGAVSRFFLKSLTAHRPIPYFGELFHLLIMKSFRDRAAFVRETLFPPRRVMQQVFPNMQSRPFWCYYPKRIARLALMGMEGLRAAATALKEPRQ